MNNRSSEPSSWSAWNSRSSASRLASSAPTQSTAGPMRASRLRSGPTAKGITVTTIRKKATAISPPPPDAHRQRDLAPEQGRERAHGLRSSISSAWVNGRSTCVAASTMPPGVEVPADQSEKPLLAVGVERRCRLVQQPHRARRRGQAAPAPAGAAARPKDSVPADRPGRAARPPPAPPRPPPSRRGGRKDMWSRTRDFPRR